MGRIIVGITGASGVIYGVRLLEVLRDLKVEAHLILTEAARKNIQIETSLTVEDVKGLAHEVHDVKDLAAPVSSGSFVTSGMVVAPCSIKTLSAIAHSYNDNLLVRAADVTLKERRRLVLLVRETPLHLGHLELMAQVARLGGVIMPPVPAFYHRPRSVEEIVDQTVGKVLDLFGIETDLFRRWGG
mgnify:CR=1 FL=1